MMKTNNILFICKYNRFRSKIAEALFNKLNKNKKFKAKSAGVIKGYPISREIINASKKAGIRIKGKPKGLSTVLLKWADLTTLVADDVPPKIFSKNYTKKLILWKIKDTDSKDKDMQGVIKKIEKNIKNLIKNLK